ncbi:MAG: NAD(+) synthase [bacterium]|nr:NAD(+) synthase [bacterium]
MRLVKIGLANVDPTVGAMNDNTAKILVRAKQLADAHCAVAAFSEHTISGYPVEDLVQWKGFVAQQWEELRRFADATKTFGYPTVFVLGLAVEEGPDIYNTAAVVSSGNILGVVPKEKLPTYGVFYERRTFSAGIPGHIGTVHGAPFGDLIFRFPFGTLAVEVCEDIWSRNGPMSRRCFGGAELVVNISASPFRSGVLPQRRSLIAARAMDNAATVVYVNQVGANDSLVFDGGGFVNQCGDFVLEAPRWREGTAIVVVDLDDITLTRHVNTTWRTDRERFVSEHPPVQTVSSDDGPPANDEEVIYPTPPSKSFFMPEDVTQKTNPRHEYFDDLIEGMISGLKGYFEKTNTFQRIAIALSGGMDSALTLLIAERYAARRRMNINPMLVTNDFIKCFSMPTRFNSDTTRSIAKDLAEALGVGFLETPVARQVEHAEDLLKLMYQGEAPKMTLQNVQARIRGMAMWNYANAAHAMWLQTGNMTEKAVGYTTIGGDMMGAFSLIGNLPKTVVRELIAYLMTQSPETVAAPLRALLATKASAELDANQSDEDDLMPFPVLDACYALFAGKRMMAVEVYRVVKTMWPEEQRLKEWVRKFVVLFRRSIFKWVQTPETVHLGSLDLDRERALQLPVVQSEEWMALEELDIA